MNKQMTYGLIIGLVAGGVIVWVIMAAGVGTTGTFIAQKNVATVNQGLTKVECFEAIDAATEPGVVKKKDGSVIEIDSGSVSTEGTSLRQLLDEYYAWSTGQWY